jgi:protein phosphatase
MELGKSRAQFDAGAATHVGNVRQRNEDSYLVRPQAGIWAVADGMGGHNAGDFASRTVIEALNSIEPAASATELLAACKEQIFEANSRLKEAGREAGSIIGTTVTVLLVFDGYFACLWSGDSRMYVVRDGKISQISRDHTEVEELLTNGVITSEEAKTWSGSNVITRAIGVVDAPELEMTSGTLHAGDVFVICTDGLTRHVRDEEILQSASASALQEVCDRLILLTLERGASDNVTVVAVRYQPDAVQEGATQPLGAVRPEWRV